MGIQRRAANSFAAPVLSWGLRAQHLAKWEASSLASSTRWLFSSREHTNFTYDLTPRSLAYLAAFVSVVSGTSVPACQSYMDEILLDQSFVQHVREATLRSHRRRISNPVAHIGRRAGWYALVRALKPEHIVETGTDKGLGSIVLAAAVIRNGSGHITTIDINRESGFLVSGEYSEVVTRAIGSSLEILRGIATVNMFIHDSNHDPSYEFEEFLAVEKNLDDSALVVTDNSSVSTALLEWSVERGRQYLDFREEPVVRALKPEGTGASWRS